MPRAAARILPTSSPLEEKLDGQMRAAGLLPCVRGGHREGEVMPHIRIEAPNNRDRGHLSLADIMRVERRESLRFFEQYGLWTAFAYHPVRGGSVLVP